MRRVLLPLLGFVALAVLARSAEPPFSKDKSDLRVYLDEKGKAVPVKTAADWRKRRAHVLANVQLATDDSSTPHRADREGPPMTRAMLWLIALPGRVMAAPAPLPREARHVPAGAAEQFVNWRCRGQQVVVSESNTGVSPGSCHVTLQSEDQAHGMLPDGDGVLFAWGAGRQRANV